MCVILIGLLIVLIVLLLNPSESEGLTDKPTVQEKNKYINDIITNEHMFDGKGSYYSARKKLPWMDAIIYEDVRQLVRQNNLNKQSVNLVFH